MMRSIILIATFIWMQHQAFSQCQTPVISNPVTLPYACRNITISDISLNNRGVNVLTNVLPNSTVSVSFNFKVTRGCDYCPACIVQIYWGIHHHYSECAISFYGYDQQNRNRPHFVSGQLKAPEKPGVYYITIGGTLEYECKNNIDRPDCPKDRAFAAIVVGNPVSTASIKIEASKDNSNATILKGLPKGTGGCSGAFNSFEWYRNDSLLKDQTSSQISARQAGMYKVVWYNCIREEVSATYQVKSSTETTIDKRLKIKGRLLDIATRQPLKGTIFLEADDKPAGQASSLGDGSYILYPPSKSDGRIHAKVEGYFGNDIIIRKASFDSSSTLERDIMMIPLTRGSKIVLHSLLFLQSDFRLTDQAKKQVDHLADIMRENPTMRIELDGHTDNVGDPKKNMLLSQQRTDEVKKYLISKGIASKRILTKGFGGAIPIASNATEETRKLNRRVEMIIR